MAASESSDAGLGVKSGTFIIFLWEFPKFSMEQFPIEQSFSIKLGTTCFSLIFLTKKKMISLHILN